MKFKLPTALCVLLAAVLVAFGVGYGTWSGYREDRAQVDELLTMENGLMDVLSYRAADGMNLCVVARRHLSAQDPALTALEKAARELQAASGLRAALDDELQQAFEAVAARLAQTASFQQSERDQRYLDMLSADFSSLKASEIVTAYNKAADDFNQRLAQPLVGALAGWLGIEQCPRFE